MNDHLENYETYYAYDPDILFDVGVIFLSLSGEITSRLTTDCETMSSTISTNLNVFLRNSVMLLGSLVFMTTLSWRLALVTFIIVPVVGFVTKVYGAYYDVSMKFSIFSRSVRLI